jgi:hypothetical protein
MLFGKKKNLLPINWSGVPPEEASSKTPKRATTGHHGYYHPHPQRYRVYVRPGRNSVNISIKRDLSYDEYLDIWELVQDAIMEEAEREATTNE